MNMWRATCKNFAAPIIIIVGRQPLRPTTVESIRTQTVMATFPKRQRLGRFSNREDLVDPDRQIGTLERFQHGDFRHVDVIRRRDFGDCWTYTLRRGGQVCFYPNFVSPTECDEIYNFVTTKPEMVLRQYKMQGGGEPRLHGLLDCRATNLIAGVPTTSALCYTYHNVNMRSLGSVSMLGALSDVATRAADAAGVPFFNMGCDVLYYRNVLDKIGWHADDTQNEQIIFSVVPHADPVRSVDIAPKGSNGKLIKTAELEEGDERLTLYPAAGDAYSMDGEMQVHYLHRVPLYKPNVTSELLQSSSSRLGLIFRHGRERLVSDAKPDDGTIPSTLDGRRLISDEERHPFGLMQHVVQEGGLYTRAYLNETRAFSSIQGGVSGKKCHGCSAIVVRRQDCNLHEEDDFLRLSYTSNVRQGAWALYHTCTRVKNLVRVFRSTHHSFRYGALVPAKHPDRNLSQLYRYDGLYEVIGCHVVDGFFKDPIPENPALQKEEFYTFELRRVGKDGGNTLSAQEFVEQCGDYGTMAHQAAFDFMYQHLGVRFQN